ncbi:flagellar type III secretion system pore protein FliP [Pseudobacteriovorax antillogorgiicola]|uniref:Flagellar biosynthetic protein FliP n=1 Tax=Pseudobacteriovorax antillogorgiicola TaxID=1513793 RepID=A0A1Y6CHU4_9BACT|nr:flagellar type III secretion system pore protein FliP [Pseudobacteriovorax antillogorgiicola]TCS46660.1 flagellar biosynthetic protein FliP [Pseudobacteriovorax antillogorgiicola]SMF66510.1 flagellar biosynthetic protein FliP [Pseudobacteriovorax antillogorgiicola]
MVRVIFHFLLVATAFVVFDVMSMDLMAQTKMPTIELNLYETEDPEAFVPALKIVSMLTILAVAPAILLMMTSFTRIVVVLSFIRQALGTQTMPPNQVIVGLSLFLTLFTMGPILDRINERALTPYLAKAITQEQAIEEVVQPLRRFMLAETREDDLGIFMNVAQQSKPTSVDQVPMRVLIPAFVISELKTAFQIGFLIYLPFLVIDMVVSSILMAMGMMMLPPTVVSMPFKLVLFVLVDGWSLIVDSLVRSFTVAI